MKLHHAKHDFNEKEEKNVENAAKHASTKFSSCRNDMIDKQLLSFFNRRMHKNGAYLFLLLFNKN